MAKQTTVQLVQPVSDGMISYSNEAAMPMGRVRVIIDGRTPLLTHNPQSMGSVPEAGRGTRVPEAEVEAEAGCYRLPDGTLAIKGEAFRATILNAAGAWKAKRGSMKSRLGHIVVLEELVPLALHDGTPLNSYTIDARRAIVQRQGIIRRRPRFDEWTCTFTIEFDPQLVSDAKLIVDILQDAGGRMGVGDYRPARNGWFGRFAVRSYQVLD